MGDGKKVSVVKMWTKPSLERIVNQAKLFNIEVKSVEVLDLENKKKGFNLEYLNGYIPKEDISLSQDSNFLSRLLRLIKSLFSK
jgi:ribosomal protein L23